MTFCSILRTGNCFPYVVTVNIVDFDSQEVKSEILFKYLYNKREDNFHNFINDDVQHIYGCIFLL